MREEIPEIEVIVDGYPMYSGNPSYKAKEIYLWAVENRLSAEFYHKGVLVRFSRPAKKNSGVIKTAAIKSGQKIHQSNYSTEEN